MRRYVYPRRGLPPHDVQVQTPVVLEVQGLVPPTSTVRATFTCDEYDDAGKYDGDSLATAVPDAPTGDTSDEALATAVPDRQTGPTPDGDGRIDTTPGNKTAWRTETSNDEKDMPGDSKEHGCPMYIKGETFGFLRPPRSKETCKYINSK